jgi:hypothetical protein
MNIPNKKKFENYGRLDERGKAAKSRKDEKEKELEENDENNQELDLNPFTTHIAKKCLDKDYTLNFIEKSRREKLMQLYATDPHRKLSH